VWGGQLLAWRPTAIVETDAATSPDLLDAVTGAAHTVAAVAAVA